MTGGLSARAHGAHNDAITPPPTRPPAAARSPTLTNGATPASPVRQCRASAMTPHTLTATGGATYRICGQHHVDTDTRSVTGPQPDLDPPDQDFDASSA